MPGTSTVDPARNYKISTHGSNIVTLFLRLGLRSAANALRSQALAKLWPPAAGHAFISESRAANVSSDVVTQRGPFQKGNRQ